MPIYKIVVMTLPCVEAPHCKYCCYKTHHCLSKQEETQMQTEPFHLKPRSAGRTTGWAQKLIFTQSLCLLQKILQYSSHRNSTEKSKKSFRGRGEEKRQETKEHYTNSSLLLINRVVLPWCKGRLATARREEHAPETSQKSDMVFKLQKKGRRINQ